MAAWAAGDGVVVGGAEETPDAAGPADALGAAALGTVAAFGASGAAALALSGGGVGVEQAKEEMARIGASSAGFIGGILFAAT
ncbi:MAG TPA: hypothetical protein VEK07_10965 [Polyangiaceae bacterium]|nr:hypothetical protein [Polyangiaceae bacterium]